ncbi:MAG: LCP family protein [Clostridium chrysemydis]|uniref:LCP family protein n=1 Tax=Clostridium TaxID=1485 RepID=UPI002152DB87|nr:LCP family protein [Clostridium sp. LY3-2]MCR6513711.1 LCP family protein [Clostridium sp. LY3-2]
MRDSNVDTSNKRSANKKPKRKMSTTKKVLLGVLIALIAIIVAGGGYAFYLLSKTNKIDLNKENLGINSDLNQKYDTKDFINIGLFGVDAPQGEPGRSDAVMILTIDKKHNKLKLSSLMRDSYVDVKGHGKTKLTHAYAYGGPELAINTLNTNFDLNIDKFVTVNFSSMPKIINELGGVDINITNGDLKYINGYIDNLNAYNKTNSSHISSTGMQNLDGTQATAYSRIRYDGGDQMRTSRQRTVLEALFSKLIKTSPTKLPGLLSELLPLVDTNMSSTELLGIGTDILGMNVSTMEQKMFPNDENGHGEMIKGVYYQVINKEAVTNNMHKFIFEN